MPFPAGKSIIIPPSQLWSADKVAAWASTGSVLPYYPASYATDGTAGTATRSAYPTDALRVDLASARTPNVFGVLSHNIDTDIVAIFQAAATVGGFNSPVLDYGARARQPNFWIDLRGFELAALQHWRVAVNDNSKGLLIGELVIGTGFLFDGVVRDAPESIRFWQERATLEYGAVAISASGTLTRSLRLNLSLTAADLVNLQQVADEVGATGERVVVIPDTRRNDLWFVEWPETWRTRYPRSDQYEIEVDLDLTEESAGVVV